MLTIGYEQPDKSVKYLYTSDDSLENIITSIVYPDLPLPTKVFSRDEIKDSSMKEYFSTELSDEEDTRFRFLRRTDQTWIIRDYYGSVEHDIIIKKNDKSNRKGGTRRKKIDKYKDYKN
jgi:hypothetical protein